MKKLMIFWMTCVIAKAMENIRYHPKFTKIFEQYELSQQAPPAAQKAVCLLLPVGGLPSSSAAMWPRSDKMENPAWENPCDLANGPPTSTSKEFKPEDATIVANQAKAALDEALKFKDLFATNIQSQGAFSETFDTTPWLQKFKFVNDDVFPKEKNKIDMEMPKERLSKVTDHIGKKLTNMYKTLKMVAAGLYAIKENGLKQDLTKEMELKPHFDVTFNRVRQVLCVLSNVMISLKEGIPTLMDDEIPSMKTDRILTMYMIYRDTMLYLDYLRQVMKHWAVERQYAIDHDKHLHLEP